MTTRPHEPRLSFPIVLTGGLVLLLAVLASLQYRWVGQISVAERARLEDGLRIATQRLGEDLYREFARVGAGFGQAPPGEGDDLAGQLARSYGFWETTAPYPGLVDEVYIAAIGEDQEITLQRFDPDSGLLERAQWPETLGDLRSRVDELRRSPRPVFDVMWTRFMRGEGDTADIDESIWVLLPGGGFPGFGPFPRGRGPGPPRSPRWTLVGIDANYLSAEVLPTIIGNHFDPDEYRVGIFRSDRLLYANDPGIDADDLAEPEARGAVVTPIRSRDGRGPDGGRRGGGPFTLLGAPWELRVKHRSGSLDSAVTTARRRNLAVGFGILALLGASGALTIVWAQRARALARMQMEFAAGMSHELRTPLATIRTAAHNIASGVVREPEQVKEYAAMVQTEGRRLSSMIDQVIQFAQTESGRRRYTIKPVSVEHIVERALTTTFSDSERAAASVRATLHAGLPEVLADETALTHVLVNLLVNALKYGRPSGDDASGRIELEASADTELCEVTITVRDHGPGIDPGDLPHVFEPYYRGRNTASIPGSGLGLSLVRKMVEGQGGNVDVSSAPGRGTTFTIRVPAVRQGGGNTP